MDEGSYVLVIALPKPWPPSEFVILHEILTNQIFLGADEHGRLIVCRSKFDRFHNFEYFQPIVASGGTWIFCMVVWQGNQSTVYVSNRELRKNSMVGYAPPRNSGASEDHRSFGNANLKHSSDHTYVDMMFLGTLNDLKDKIDSKESYRIIRAAGLLRHLLLDSLLTRANSAHGLKIRFRVNAAELDVPISDALLYSMSLLPHKSGWSDLSLDDLLKKVVARYLDKDISVRDVIDAVSNVRGGVHLGQPRPHHQAVIDMDSLSPIHRAKSLAMIEEIGLIVFRACIPLVENIQKAAARDYSINWVRYMSGWRN